MHRDVFMLVIAGSGELLKITILEDACVDVAVYATIKFETEEQTIYLDDSVSYTCGTEMLAWSIIFKTSRVDDHNSACKDIFCNAKKY